MNSAGRVQCVFGIILSFFGLPNGVASADDAEFRRLKKEICEDPHITAWPPRGFTPHNSGSICVHLRLKSLYSLRSLWFPNPFRRPAAWSAALLRGHFPLDMKPGAEQCQNHED